MKLHLLMRSSSLGGSKCIAGIIYWNCTSHVLCREVYHTVSLFGRVHYNCRFHCIHHPYPIALAIGGGGDDGGSVGCGMNVKLYVKHAWSTSQLCAYGILPNSGIDE